MISTFSPVGLSSLARFAATPPATAAPAPAPAPAGPACSADDVARITSLRNQAAVARHNGTVLGVGVGAIAAMVGVGGSVAGAVIVGAIGAIGVASCFSQARMLETQANNLQLQCMARGTQPQPQP